MKFFCWSVWAGTSEQLGEVGHSGEAVRERCNAVLSRPFLSTFAAFPAADTLLGTCRATFVRLGPRTNASSLSLSRTDIAAANPRVTNLEGKN